MLWNHSSYTEDVAMPSNNSDRYFYAGMKCDLLCSLCGKKLFLAHKCYQKEMFREIWQVKSNVAVVDRSKWFCLLRKVDVREYEGNFAVV